METKLVKYADYRRWTCVLSIIFFFVGASDISSAQSRATSLPRNAALDREVDVFSVNNEEVSEILARISTSFGLPFGIQAAENEGSGNELNNLSFSMSRTTIRGVLDRICALDRRYQWNDQDGVIILRPIRGQGKRLVEGLLSTKISHITFGEKDTLYLTRTKIASTPEVLNYMSANQTRSDLEFLGSVTTRLGLRSEAVFQHMSIFQILNELAKSSGRCWIIFSSQEGIYIGFF